MMPYALGTTPAFNPLWTPTSGPAIDLDPDSPTYGQPTGSSLNVPPSVPAYDTTQKGNKGYPMPSVPTTDAPNAPPPQVVGNESGGGISYKFVPPSQPASPAKVEAPAGSILRNLKPQVDEHGQPLAQPDTAQSAPGSVLRNLQPQVDDQGKPIQPMDTGQYLTSATSPGAKAVGTPPVEGFELSPASQFKIGTATDPMQRVRIAAGEAGVTPDSIIVGNDGRLAAVGNNGVPYYLTPTPVFADTSGITKQPPGLFQSADAGGWHPLGPGQEPAYSRAMPNAPASPQSFTTGNLVRGGAAEAAALIPQTGAVAGTAAGALVGYPQLGTAAGTAVGDLTRQWLASHFDPTHPGVDWGSVGRDVAANALLFKGGQLVNKLFDPLGSIYLGRDIPPSTTLKGYSPLSGVPLVGGEGWPLGRSVPLDFPLGPEGGARLPWEAKPEWPNTTPTPAGPAEPIPVAPGAGPEAVPANLNPAGEAAAPSGPYAPATAAQLAAVPMEPPPPLRMPIMNQAQADARADDIIRYYASGGPTAADTRMLVPGSQGTLSGITGNAGLASLERTLRSRPNPEIANRFAQATDEQNKARIAFVGDQIGTPQELARREAQLNLDTNALKEEAFAPENKSPTNPSDVRDVIDQQLKTPAAQDDAVAGALRDVRRRLYQRDPVTGKPLEDESGNPIMETDPEQLWGLRVAIRRAMTRQAQSGQPDMRAAALQLQPVLAQLDAAIERGAPKFAGFNQAYQQGAQPIDAMRYLQGRNLTDATTGAPLLRPIDTMLKDIQKQRTLQPGVRPADALTDQQIQAFENLRDDLRRTANLAKGKQLGSNTEQNFGASTVYNNLIGPGATAAAGLIGGGASHFLLGTGEVGSLAAGAATSAIENRLLSRFAPGEKMVRDAVIKRLLNEDNSGVRALAGRNAP